MLSRLLMSCPCPDTRSMTMRLCLFSCLRGIDQRIIFKTCVYLWLNEPNRFCFPEKLVSFGLIMNYEGHRLKLGGVAECGPCNARSVWPTPELGKLLENLVS